MARVGLHVAIQQLAENAGGLFLLVFLVKSGVPAPVGLLFMGLICGCRFSLRPAVLPVARHLGVRGVLIAGTLLEALTYPILAQVHGLDGWLVGFAATSSVGGVLYWTAFNAYVASVGDPEVRGSQTAVLAGLATGASIAAPVAAGWALARTGPQLTFGVIAILQAAAALPLLGGPQVRVRAEPLLHPGEALFAATIRGADGWLCVFYIYVWQLGFFLTVGGSFAAYGAAMGLAALVGVGAAIGLGRRIDLGKGRSSVALVYACNAALIALRTFSLGQPWLAFLANTLGPLEATLRQPVISAPIYDMAKASNCPLRFSIATEGGWDVGSGAACLAAAALLAAGRSLNLAIMTGVLGAAASSALLWRRYSKRK